MTKQDVIKKFEENIERARYIYNNCERVQMQMREVIAQLDEQLKNFKDKA